MDKGHNREREITMEFGNYQFLIRLTDDAFLPSYKGSTFRGLLGHALKSVVCPLKLENCSSCILRSTCTYALCFETGHALPLTKNARISAPPHPMVLEPPLTEKMEFKKGDTLECGLLLFGNINRNLPYFIYAFDQMGRIGIGKKIRGQRGGFVLEGVRSGEKEVYSSKTRSITKDAQKALTLSCPEERHAVKELSIILETPLRVNIQSRVAPLLPFSLLVRNMIRRTTSLLNCYGNGEPDIDYSAIAERAGRIEVSDHNLKWHDWKRYSNRQEREMFMGGISGKITYTGELSEFLPMIEMAEKVHLGKNTLFGLGKIKRR